MNTNELSAQNKTPDHLGFIDRAIRFLLLKKLKSVVSGQLQIVENFGSYRKDHFFGSDVPDTELKAIVQISDPRVYRRLLFGGTIGAGESFMDGQWESPNLSHVIQIFARNRALLEGMDGGLSFFTTPGKKIFHWLKINSLKGSRKNIHAHYDLGNDFFELFLDKNWMYSSAYFKSDETSLDDAQTEKIDRICRQLKLSKKDRVIEIGTGWGGFALHAAKNYGCHVTTTTISRAQFQRAVERVEQAGLTGQITVLFQDYRLLQGQYDKLVSIEMIEAVGLNFLDIYFEKCSSLLKPDGEFLLQAITIRDQNYESARRSVDFIQRYIFPGSGIPSLSGIVSATTRKTDFQIARSEDFGLDYARTIRIWHERFVQQRARIMELGYPEVLHRMWRFYFAYCDGGFTERAIGVSQIHFLKPNNRRKFQEGSL